MKAVLSDLLLSLKDDVAHNEEIQKPIAAAQKMLATEDASLIDFKALFELIFGSLAGLLRQDRMSKQLLE